MRSKHRMFGKPKDQDHSLSSSQKQRLYHRLMYKQLLGGDPKGASGGTCCLGDRKAAGGKLMEESH